MREKFFNHAMGLGAGQLTLGGWLSIRGHSVFQDSRKRVGREEGAGFYFFHFSELLPTTDLIVVRWFLV